MRNVRVHIYPNLAAANADVATSTARIIYVEDLAQVYFGRAGVWVPLSASGASAGWMPPVGTVADLAALAPLPGDAVIVLVGASGLPTLYAFDGTDWKEHGDDLRLMLVDASRAFTAFPSVEGAAGAPADDRHLITKDYADGTFETPAGAQSKADGAVSGHEAELDPHTQYSLTPAVVIIAEDAADTAVTAHEADPDPDLHEQYTTDAQATSIATAVAGPVAAAAVSAHDSDPTAHPIAFDNHNADTSAHGGVRARVTSLESLLTGGTLGSTLLFVDPDVEYANPVRFDAVRGLFRAMRDDDDTAVGLAMRPSTVFSAYTGLSVEFTATRIVMPNDSWQRVFPGMYVRFPGSTNSDWFFVEGVDEAAGELLVSPNPTTPETVSTDVEFLTPDGGVVFFGQFLIYDGQERWRDLLMLEITQDTGVVAIGLPVPDVARGDILTIAGNTAGNDGSYEIASFEEQAIQLRLVSSIILSAVVNAITVANSEVELSDTTGVLPGDAIALTGTTNNNGNYTIEFVAGNVVSVAEPLPGTDQPAPGGTFTVSRMVSPLVADDPAPDGTATIERPTAPNPFAAMADGAVAVPYFYDGAAPELLSITPAKWEIGYQVNNDAFFVRCGLSIHNVAVIDAPQTFEGGQRGAIVTLLDDVTIDIDMDDGNNFVVTLADNRTLGSPSSPTPGQTFLIEVRQDAVGGRTLGYHADWAFSGGVPPVLSAGANAVDLLSGYVDSTGTPFLSTSGVDYQ